MQTMPALQALADRRPIPGGAVLALTLGLGLYQLSSLALAPPSERVLHLSMQVPSVDFQQFSDPLSSEMNLVVGASFRPTIPTISVRMMKHLAASAFSAAARLVTAPIDRTSTTGSTPSITSAKLIHKAKDEARSHYHDADERSPGLARRR